MKRQCIQIKLVTSVLVLGIMFISFVILQCTDYKFRQLTDASELIYPGNGDMIDTTLPLFKWHPAQYAK